MILKKLFLLLALAAGTFFSCKKELSCEGCVADNQSPISLAGPDTTLTLPTDSLMLDGSASNDPDGKISEWLWKKISGPASFNIVSATKAKTSVNKLVNGVYQFELKVTDNKGAFAKDTVQITINDPVQHNRPPVANAGVDQIIMLPVNTVNLDGRGSTDPDNNITGYSWAILSGPASYGIANANSAQTQATNLVEVIYQFELKVTDADGLFSKDTIQVSVIGQRSACTSCKIAFVSDRDGNPEIYSCEFDGSNLHRLTYDAGADYQPAWSPDGTRIAFISDRTGSPELYIMNADGSNVVRKTFSASYSQDPTWSPDGTKVAYSTVSNGSANIWVVGALNGGPSLLFEAPGHDSNPAWSPDGNTIAFVSDWAAYDFVYDIYTIKVDGSGFTAHTGDIFDPFDYLYPSWSPNGLKLAITISQRIGVDLYNTQIGILNPDGNDVNIIKSGAATWTRTSWSGDGSKIVYTSLSGSGKNVSWVSVTGSTSGTIVTNGWDADCQH